ncbi:DegT/DnrJ/EryC1/StrS family aminotransferase [Propioniciclava tarda]|uniref:Aminotransferase class V-fold PLP-dependent enzyme n=1 Tax=Propioniciclava tarda TaxID=433330 RepID=A0A4Q9KHV6_PROTD|nr:aminotransferase class V-fold PLP-dependent enzyme [Propioniciclava tarda]TBT92202.1 aminotransferase class V-fold PLP-dependent enzyme [Propioniciclava tarda]SMO82230.1 dTDP-4-amino-4,6-dideoxygalactose transaminase [Propioniciclava tarda]
MTHDRIHMSLADITEIEENAVLDAMRSGWVAPLGPNVDRFEAELAARNDRAHCVVLSSGTAALHLGLLCLGIGAGQRVVTSSLTFAATANAVNYTGAQPVFVDSDESGSINPDLVAEAIASEKRAGHDVSCLLPVDLLGKVVDQEALAHIAEEQGIPVLADAAESLGARRHGLPSGKFGVAAAISFNGNKIMTTSGGGALLTDDKALADRARYLATQARQPVIWYEHVDIGYNYRLSNVLAGLGLAQLSRLDAMIERRRMIRGLYRELFADVPGVKLFGQPDESADATTRDNFWLTSILVDPAEAGWASADLMNHLAGQSIESRPIWKPMHLQPVFADAPRYVDGTSERLFNTGLSLPSGSSLTESQLDRVMESIRTFIQERVR